MEPTTTTPAKSTLVDMAVAKPGTFGLALLIPAILLLALTGWLGYRGFGGAAEPTRTEPNSESVLPESKPTTADPARGDFLWGMVFSLCAAAPLVIVGFAFLTTHPGATPAQAETRARVLLLAAGGVVGIALMLAGLAFFVRWVDGLVKYFDDGTAKDLRWSLYALVMLLVGAGLLFVSVQPARAEERNQPMLRKLVYGSNLALVMLLLLTVLVAGNVLAARKVPNTLDTTETGFYTLSPETTKFLQRLDQPVVAYAILPPQARGEQGRTFEDARRLLEKCQEVSNGKLTVRLFGATTTPAEIERLAKKYPDVELNGLGILLTTGPDENRHAFIRASELRSTEGRGPDSKEIFVGESRILKELAFLTENTSRPVVYFTQSNGELQITEPKEGETLPPEKTARRLKEYLEKNFIDVKPLEFKLEQPAVPADASAVVIAQPTTPFRKDAVESLRKYMMEPRADGKKGKLVVLSGTPIRPAGPLPKTGLDDVLKEFNIQLDDRYLYGERTDTLPPEGSDVIVYPQAVQAGNPVAKSFSQFALSLMGCRVVNPLKDRPAIKVLPVLVTAPGRYTWLEETPPADPEQRWLDIRKSAQLIRDLRVTEGPRPIALFASEGETSRAAVFGQGYFIADVVARGSGTPKSFELLGGTIDWLRDRPTVAPGSGGKAYVDYRINPTMDPVRLYWLPLGFTVCAVLGIGAGVWAVRRR